MKDKGQVHNTSVATCAGSQYIATGSTPGVVNVHRVADLDTRLGAAKAALSGRVRGPLLPQRTLAAVPVSELQKLTSKVAGLRFSHDTQVSAGRWRVGNMSLQPIVQHTSHGFCHVIKQTYIGKILPVDVASSTPRDTR